MYKRVLTIQDISCLGQCSLTVALPILSACGHETCVVPSAVLSTHTGGFSGFTFRDLTEDMPAICRHWESAGIRFNAIYTGYLGSQRQIDYVKEIMEKTSAEGCIKVVDPAMADHGRLYTGFDMDFVEAMKALVAQADYVLPNLTEACLLTGTPYTKEYDRAFIDELLRKLHALGAKNVVFTGVSYVPGRTGVVVSEEGRYSYYEHEMLPNSCHGTGDIYASAFMGALLREKSPLDAAAIAADYAVKCIRNSADDPDHTYGAKFEPMLGELIAALKG